MSETVASLGFEVSSQQPAAVVPADISRSDLGTVLAR